MHGVAAAGAGHPLTHLQALHAFPQPDNRPGRGIAQRHGLVQAVEGRFQRGQQALAAGLVDHLAHQVGPGARLAQQRFFGELHQHPLGAGRDQRSRRAHQHLARLRGGDGHFCDDRFAAAQVLKQLFHYSSVFRRCGNRITSRMFGLSVSSMVRRSTPMPKPPLGGMP